MRGTRGGVIVAPELAFAEAFLAAELEIRGGVVANFTGWDTFASLTVFTFVLLGVVLLMSMLRIRESGDVFCQTAFLTAGLTLARRWKEFGDGTTKGSYCDAVTGAIAVVAEEGDFCKYGWSLHSVGKQLSPCESV